VSMQPRFSFKPMLIDDDGPLSMPGVLSVLHLMVERVLDVLDPSSWFRTRREEPLNRSA
jgi:hypothetical protein